MLKALSFLRDTHNNYLNYFHVREVREDRVKIGITLICLYMWISQVVYCYSEGLYIDSLICFIGLSSVAISLWAYKQTKIKSWIIFNFSALFTVLVIWAANVNAGMGVNPSLMFFCGIPLFTIPVVGVKSGTLWTVFSIILSSISMYLARLYNFSWSEFNSDQWFNVGLTNLTTGPALVLGIFGYFYFVNEKLSLKIMKSNQNLLKANMHNEKLLRILGHDIGRNISLLSSNLEILKADKVLPAKYDYIFDYTSNVKKILLNSADLSYQDISNYELVDVKSLLDALAIDNDKLLENKKVRFQIDCKNNFTAKVNKETFHINILGNLISNAVKYSRGGSVIKAVIDRDSVVIINECDQELMVTDKGSGFGIPIVKEFLEAANLNFTLSYLDGRAYAKIFTK